MEKDANYFVVGIFVSMALLALVGFTIWLMGAGNFARYERYTIYFTDPVSGLADQSPVKYKGVAVGRILDMRIAPERNDLVKVDIEVDEMTPVRAGTSATIELQGITGQSYLELTTNGTDEDPPVRVTGEAYPVLQGKGSELRAFFDDLPRLSEQLEKTLVAVDQLSKEGSKMAGSIRGLTDNLKTDLGTALTSVEEFSKEGARTAGSIRGLADSLKQDPSRIINPPSQKGVVIPR